RRLMELRDGLAAHRGLQVILPCQHNGACALLQIKGKDEWCHESIPWSPPAFLRILNEGLNREISLLKFSYLVVARTRAVQPEPAGYRVISHLLKEKGRMRCFLCSPQGRIELVRLNRAKSADNARFDRIAKGSIVELKNVKMRRPDFWEVSSDTAVRLVL
ncbi:hypothetical protein IBX73_11030, partial [candidate division WOR-3 bacterium]|nr:hypothetical protein [candidate division WOR-3 bacterium]